MEKSHQSKDLTKREREVLRWIAEGKRNSEIGEILGISPRTVGKHVEHLLAKLGVPSRIVAARYYLSDRVELSNKTE